MLSKKCAVCGKEFYPRKDRYEKAKFCSIKCTIINRTTKVKTNCSHCGKEITVKKYRLERSKIICCSKKCMAENYKIRFSGINSQFYKGVGKFKKCIICENLFFAEKEKTILCSKRCANIYYSNNFSGINSPSYIDGRSPIKKLIRENNNSKKLTQQVFERDEFTCRLCGQKGKYLHAHHIFPFAKIYSKFVKLYPKKTSKDDLVRLALEHEPFFNINNLVTLCADCHYKEHRQKKQQEINFD